MYIDESGVDSLKDNTRYFITSGTIIEESDLITMKQSIQYYKDVNFIHDLSGATIHVHDMHRSIKEFKTLFNPQKTILLNQLYETIEQIPFTVITTVIDKPRFVADGHNSIPTSVLDMAYKLLIERFENFLRDNGSKGVIRIDRTTNNQEYKLNDRDTHVLNYVNNLRKRGTGFIIPRNIVEEPLVVNSFTRKGLQVADAVAYCVSRRLLHKRDFDNYWNRLEPKYRRSPSGNIFGYGFKIYPR